MDGWWHVQSEKETNCTGWSWRRVVRVRSIVEEQDECLPMPALVGNPVLEHPACVVRASLPKGLSQADNSKGQVDAFLREDCAVP